MTDLETTIDCGDVTAHIESDGEYINVTEQNRNGTIRARHKYQTYGARDHDDFYRGLVLCYRDLEPEPLPEVLTKKKVKQYDFPDSDRSGGVESGWYR